MSKLKSGLKVLHFFMVQKSHLKLRSRDFYGPRGGYGSVSYVIMSKDSDKSMLFVAMGFTLKLKAKLKQELLYKVKCYNEVIFATLISYPQVLEDTFRKPTTRFPFH